MKHTSLQRMALSALFLALGIVLPFFTASIPQIGRSLLPMHFPVFLCGFLCGGKYGLCIGFVCPLLRSLLFGAPVLFPDGAAMALELATYGACAGLLYALLPRKLPFAYLSLVGAMLAGRVVWGAVRYLFTVTGELSFGIEAFLAGAFTNALPGILLQLLLLPPIVNLVNRQAQPKE